MRTHPLLKRLCLPLCWLLLFGQLACSRIRVEQSAFSSLPTATAVHRPGPPGQPALSPSTGVAGVSPVQANLPDAAAVHFEAFRRQVDSRQGGRFDGTVLSQLFIDREGQWELVHRELAPSWTRTDLIPGRYLLEVVEIYDRGRTSQPNEDKVVTFELEAQTTAQVTLVTRQVPWGRVALVSLAVVVIVGIVVYAILAAELDLDTPDLSSIRPGRIVHGTRGEFSLPPPPRISPPPRLPLPHGGHGVRVVEIYTPVELLLDMTEAVLIECHGHCLDGPSPPETPAVLNFELPAPSYPEGKLRVRFNSPINSRYVSPSTLVLLDAADTPVAGGTLLTDGGRVAIFHPLRALSPGSYRFVVMTDQLVNEDGRAGVQRYEQRFQIDPPEPKQAPAEKDAAAVPQE